MAVQTQIQTRRGTAATWTSTNPTLAAGEIGFESDTNKFKIGTGSTAWTALAYAANTSPLTTKGDLYTYSTTNDRLAVGNNGESLVADSSATTGLRYQAPINANPIINSNFSVWQRGTSFAIPANTSTYGADRWTSYRVGATGSTVSRQVTGDTTNLPFIQYCARVQRDSGNTSTAILYFTSPVESVNTIPYAGKTVTYSFYARAGATYSATSGVLNSFIYSGTGIDQPPYVGYTNGAAYGSTNNTLTTTWQRFFATYTVPINHSEMAIQFQFTPVGTAGANDYFEVTGVQFEVGSVATPYKPTGATFQGELAACQRYYWREVAGTTYAVFQQYGIASSATNIFVSLKLPVTMRTNPTGTVDFSTLRVLAQQIGVYNAITAVTLDTVSTTATSAFFSMTTTGLTTLAIAGFSANNSTTAYIGVSAEL